MGTVTINQTGPAEGERSYNEQERREGIRSVGAGFGSLGGACIVLISVLAGQARPNMAQQIAIVSFATALPLLVSTTVLAYSLSLLRGPQARTQQTIRASVVAITFGLLGTLGVAIGLTELLWGIMPIASISFVGCVVVSLVIYRIITTQITPRRPVHESAP